MWMTIQTSNVAKYEVGKHVSGLGKHHDISGTVMGLTPCSMQDSGPGTLVLALDCGDAKTRVNKEEVCPPCSVAERAVAVAAAHGGLRHYWRCDERSGKTLVDSVHVVDRPRSDGMIIGSDAPSGASVFVDIGGPRFPLVNAGDTKGAAFVRITDSPI